MKRFLTPSDIGDLQQALKDAAEVKKNPFADQAYLIALDIRF